MEREDVEIKVERRSDGFVYFAFSMKGKMYNEIDMILIFKGSERNDDNFKVIYKTLFSAFAESVTELY